MNILSKLPFVNQSEEEAQEVDEAQAKKDRIAFHRDHVRNGPANFKTVTAGQQRRAKVRALKSDTKRARRQQVRAYLDSQREAATIRGHLQAVGVISYAGDTFVASPAAVVKSMAWIVRNFVDAEEGSTVEITNDVLVQSLTSAFNRWQKLTGQPETPLSPAYVLPVMIAA